MYDKVFVYSAQWSNGAYIWSHWFDPNIHENLITIFLFCSQCPYIDCLFKANIRLCFDISLISDCVLIFLWHEAVFQYISHIRLCLWSFHPSRYPQSPPIAMSPYVIHLRYFNHHHHHHHARQHKSLIRTHYDHVHQDTLSTRACVMLLPILWMIGIILCFPLGVYRELLRCLGSSWISTVIIIRVAKSDLNSTEAYFATKN